MPLSSVVGASSILRPGVCTSTSRPASPFEGQTIYETDTDQLLTYNGSGWKPFADVTASTNGAVLQVVSAVKSDTQTFSGVTTGTANDITGLSATITPSSTSNKILVTGSVHGGAFQSAVFTSGAIAVQLVRGSTDIAEGDASGNMSRITAIGGYGSNQDGAQPGNVAFTFLDSPNTTSSTTYKLQIVNAISRNATVTLYVNRTTETTDAAWVPRPISTITLMEISG